MKKNMFVFALILCSLGCKSQNPNLLPCSEIQTGNFSKVDDIFGTYIIKRTKSDDGRFVQVEHVVKSKLKIEFDVKWIDDCTCEIRFSKVLENGIGHDFATMLKDVVRTEKIYEFTKDSANKITGYKLKATSNQHDSSDDEVMTVLANN